MAAEQEHEQRTAGEGGSAVEADEDLDAQSVYNDRSKLDFDPDEGMYTGTVVDGSTSIPGTHEQVDDIPLPDEGDAGSDE